VASGSQLFGTDSLSGGTFAFANANTGTGNKTVNVSGVTISDGNSGNNYTVSYAANTTSTINPAAITVSTSNVTKTYDGSTSASGAATVVSGALYHNVSNGNAQDVLSGGTFAFTDKNAGAGTKHVSVSGVTVTDGNGGNNYVVTYADNTTSTINRANLTFNGTIADRQYDGTTAASLSGYTLNGLVGTETINATAGSAVFVDKNAGNGKAVTISGIGLSDGTNGGLASNYSISASAAAVGNITPRLLTLNAVVDDKVYDGTTNATLNSFGLSGFVGTETVTGDYTGSASFADRHVGNNKNITVTGINLVNGTNGGLANNYAVPNTANSTASITPATLHVAGVVALDRVYDGTTTVNLNTDAATVTGLYGSDDVQISQITGTFLDKNVGINKTIGAGTVNLSGADAGDYVLVQPTGLMASITPRALVVAATGVNRVYDGTTDATVQLSDNRVSGDALSVTANSEFMDKNAGAGKYVNVTGIAIGGTDAGNYTVNGSTGTFATISRANLNVSVTGMNRVYDGTTHATVSLSGTPIGSDDVELQYVSANFADKNVGTAKSVSVNGIAGFGADAGNYIIGSAGGTTANITPATLIVGAAGGIKTFDGSSTAQVSFTDNRVTGDDLSLVATNAAYSNPNVGTGKPIAVNGIVIAGGADAGNYVLGSNSTSTTGAILGQTSVAETWPLPPSIPTPVPPTNPVTPPIVVDVSLPMIGGGGSNGGSNTNTNTNTNINTFANGGSGGGTNTNTIGGSNSGANIGGKGTTIINTNSMSSGGSGSGNTGATGQTSGTAGTNAAGNSQSSSNNVGASNSAPGNGTPSSGSTAGRGGAESGVANGSTSGVATSSATNASSSAGGAATVKGGAASDSVTVSIVGGPMGDNPGTVAVQVPHRVVAAGKGFSFSLPGAMFDGSKVTVTRADGRPLPGWLTYNAKTHTLNAKSPPANALPIELLVKVGEKRWTVLVSEQQ
jgi:hypothetical protein